MLVVKFGLFVPRFEPLTFHWYEGVPPLTGVAVKVTELPAQIAPGGEADILTLTGSTGFTVIVTGLEVAGFPETHVKEDVITTVTTSLFASVLVVKFGLFVPRFEPLTFHWYEGVPPLTGVAVKVTELPVQTAPGGEADILTLTGSTGFTVIVTGLEVAGFPDTQVKEDVITTVTISLFESVLVVKFGLFVPTFDPFTCHW